VRKLATLPLYSFVMADFDDDDGGGQEIDPAAFLVPEVLPGDRCTTIPGDRPAQVKFIGSIQGMPKGYWIGVQYDEKVGKNDGKVKGKRYFQCPPGHGGFIRSMKVTKMREEDSASSSPLLGKRPDSPHRPLLKLDGVVAADSSTRQSHRLSTRHELKGEAGEGLASRIARRRKEGHTARVRSTSPTWTRTVESWQEEVAPTLDPKAATPANSYATGDGLQTAVVASLAQFTIDGRDANDEPSAHKANPFVVAMRGSALYRLSQPALVRVKVINRGDGSYMCEYRPYMTGCYSITITLHGCHIIGSPFEVEVTTVRPDASRCLCKGEALHKAIARVPMKFDLLFVDKMGRPAIAEEVDLYLEPLQDPSEAAAAARGEEHDAIKAVDAHSAAAEQGEPSSDALDLGTAQPFPTPETSNLLGKRVGAAEEIGPTDAVSEEEVRAEPAWAAAASARATGKASFRSNSSPRRTARRSARSMGSPGEYSMVDAGTRQRHMALWTQRMTADKLRQRTVEGEAGNTAESKNRKDNVPQAHTSFAHEMAIDPVGFAFGGVDPGTLHAHGKLVKVHSVHYSVGLAGQYLMHVGLRQQMVPLPGSPFKLVVEPGAPFATSSRLPKKSLRLSGVASEEWQHGLLFPTKDVLGNMCNRGGANLVMKLSKTSAADEKAVEFSIVDMEDGSYELKWKCAISGSYPIDVLMGGAHVAGSPIHLNVNSAKPAVEQMTVTGAGQSKAIAGIKAKLMVKVADRFGNKFNSSAQTFPYKLGLILKPSVGKKEESSNDKSEKKSKASKDEKRESQMRGKGTALDESTAVSLPFEGKMIGSVFEIDYVAKEAGLMDLHIWAERSATDGAGGPTIIREPLPGSPFQAQVSEGSASALRSHVGAAEAGRQGAGDGFVAGENVVLRPQITDDFGNSSAAVEGELAAHHIKPRPTGHEQRQSREGLDKGADEVELPPPRAKGALGSYELLIEPVRAGLHYVHVRLGGHDISGSPVSFNLAPGPPTSSKCKLKTIVPPNDEPLLERSPITIRVTLFDKYGNQLEQGGTRVDAKPSGVGVAGAKVEDNQDGTYDINLMSGPPGEIKVAVRIDGNDLPSYQLTVQRSPEAAQEAAKDAKEKDEQELAPESKGAKGGKGGKKDGDVDEHAKDAVKSKTDPKSEEVALKPVPWMTGVKLRELCEQALAQAAELEARDVYTTFERRLGAAILKRLGEAGKVEDLLREWDANGDGDVSKQEFRQCVTGKSLQLKAPNKDIDDFFATMDADGGGSLDLKELKPALKVLKEKAAAIDKEKQLCTNCAKELRDKAEMMTKAAEDTDTVEIYEAKLAEMKANPAIEAKVGSAMSTTMHSKLGDMIAKWDKDGDGTVNKEEFRKNIKDLGVEANSYEIDELFTKLNTDGGGDLSLKQVEKSFTMMQKATWAAQKELKESDKTLARMRKEAAKQHSQIAALLKKQAE